MKKNLLAVAAVAALVACSGKTGLEKELVGSYSAKPEIEVADSTDFSAQLAAAMLSQMKMDMDFNSDGTIDMSVSMGANSQSTQGKWEVRADSLFITDSTQTVQGFGVAKTADGFKLTSEQMNLVLTPKAE